MAVVSLQPLPPSQCLDRAGRSKSNPHDLQGLRLRTCSTLQLPQIMRLAHCRTAPLYTQAVQGVVGGGRKGKKRGGGEKTAGWQPGWSTVRARTRTYLERVVTGLVVAHVAREHPVAGNKTREHTTKEGRWG